MIILYHTPIISPNKDYLKELFLLINSNTNSTYTIVSGTVFPEIRMYAAEVHMTESEKKVLRIKVTSYLFPF